MPHGLLHADDLSFSYDATEAPVLDGVSLEVAAGGLTGVLGPNGSGKTTLIKLLAGMLRPAAGHVYLDGRDLATVPRRRIARRMAMVPQETHLAFDYTVMEIALMGRYPHLGPFAIEGPDDLQAAAAALEATGTAALAGRLFTTLSGGEKQRVVIASALAQLRQPANAGGLPRVLLLDEPTASLDLAYQLEIAHLLRTLHDQGTTIVLSTHDLNLAASVCHNLVLLRNGCVLTAGPTHDVLTADTVATVYGVDASVRYDADIGRTLVVPLGRASGGPTQGMH